MTPEPAATPRRIDDLIDTTLAFAHQSAEAFAAFKVGALLFRLRAEGRPETVDELAAAAEQPATEVAAMLTGLLGWQVDDAGRVSDDPANVDELPLYRVRMLDTGLETEVRGCAVDALLLPTISRRPAHIDATCPETGHATGIEVGPDGLHDVHPSTAVVSIVAPSRDPASLPEDVCAHGHVFASADAAATWHERHPDAALVSPADAIRYATALADDLEYPVRNGRWPRAK